MVRDPAPGAVVDFGGLTAVDGEFGDEVEERLEKLEQIAGSFRGVDKCFAIQAGREIRVFVEPKSIDDDEALLMARNISRQIEHDMKYPGQIKVTVVRETRCVEFAK